MGNRVAAILPEAHHYVVDGLSHLRASRISSIPSNHGRRAPRMIVALKIYTFYRVFAQRKFLAAPDQGYQSLSTLLIQLFGAAKSQNNRAKHNQAICSVV